MYLQLDYIFYEHIEDMLAIYVNGGPKFKIIANAWLQLAQPVKG